MSRKAKLGRLTIILNQADKIKLASHAKKIDSNPSVILRAIIRNLLKGQANEPKTNS
jgi:hypothetical protein